MKHIIITEIKNYIENVLVAIFTASAIYWLIQMIFDIAQSNGVLKPIIHALLTGLFIYVTRISWKQSRP
jgi:xanthine/uracil permease